MLLNSNEINELTAPLERGYKKRAAAYLGVHIGTLSRYFQFRVEHNGWVIPREKYYKLKEFIKTL